MKKHIFILLAFPIWMFSQSLNGQAPPSKVNPVDVFEEAWQALNTNYPYFEQRGINWETIYKVYKPKIHPGTTDEELFATLCKLIEHFNDGHVNLENGKARVGSVVRTNPKMEDFSWSLVRDKYLNKSFKSSPDSLFYYGWLTDEIAYLRIRRFPTKEVLDKYIDGIIGELMGAKGIVLDERGNSGGNGFGVAALAGRFADTKRLYMKTMFRVGQSKEYTNTAYCYVEPLGPAQYKGPIVLLQNAYSASGSEAFALAMRVLPHATSIGDMTEGCFAAFYPHTLINGWTLTMPWAYAVDQNDFCWEGIGVPPDIRKMNTKEDIKAGNDLVLEFAVDVLKSGGNRRKEADGSLKDLKVSLVDQFVSTSAREGATSAVNQFNKSRKKNPDDFYFSLQELGVTIKLLLQSERNEDAFALIELGLKEFPDDLNILYYMARLYEDFKKQPEKAKPIWEILANSSSTFPWEANLVSLARKKLETAI